MTSDSFFSRSKTLQVLSRLALASRLPSGEKAIAEDPVGVVFDLGQELAGLDLEDADGPVGAGGGDLLAVGTERDREDDVLGLDEVADRLAAAAGLGEPELGDADRRPGRRWRSPATCRRGCRRCRRSARPGRSTGGRACRRPSSRM